MRSDDRGGSDGCRRARCHARRRGSYRRSRRLRSRRPYRHPSRPSFAPASRSRRRAPCRALSVLVSIRCTVGARSTGAHGGGGGRPRGCLRRRLPLESGFRDSPQSGRRTGRRRASRRRCDRGPPTRSTIRRRSRPRHRPRPSSRRTQRRPAPGCGAARTAGAAPRLRARRGCRRARDRLERCDGVAAGTGTPAADRAV